MKKGQWKEPCIWFFVLIYSVVLVKTLLSLGLCFIFFKKTMASLALPDHTVPGIEKLPRNMAPEAEHGSPHLPLEPMGCQRLFLGPSLLPQDCCKDDLLRLLSNEN